MLRMAQVQAAPEMAVADIGPLQVSDLALLRIVPCREPRVEGKPMEPQLSRELALM